MNFSHIPVLLDEAIDALNIGLGKKYIDATLGGGGHTREILKRGGIVLGIDQDEDAIKYVNYEFREEIDKKNLKIAKGNFADLEIIANENGFTKAAGILFDIGVSSYQIDVGERGFGIKKDAKLDMRMDKSKRLTAEIVVNSYPQEKLTDIFYRYGEEHNARVIAREIADLRKKKRITRTLELAKIIEGISHKPESIHPATRVFQALRIEVNDELNALKDGLEKSLSVIDRSGRIVVITFHSLEDRIVKKKFNDFEIRGLGSVITKKPIVPQESEALRNRRSRSAKMRAFEISR